MIITAHAPLDVAAAGAATAAFHLSGQVCTSAERFYVVDAVHDDFVAALSPNASGCGSAMGWTAPKSAHWSARPHAAR